MDRRSILVLKALSVLGLAEEAVVAQEASDQFHLSIRRKLAGNRLPAVFHKYGLSDPLRAQHGELIEYARVTAKRNALQSLRNVAFLGKLTAEFREKAIPYILLKGEALGHELYGEWGVRHSGDIDLWVSELDLERVHQMLVEAGFVLEGDYFERSENYRKIYRRFLPHFSYTREDGVLVEVHWRMFNMPSFFKLSFESAHQASRQLEIQSMQFTLLDPISNFLYLMAHGANHLYVRIFWLLDLVIYLGKHPEVLTSELLRRAEEWGVERVLAYSFVQLDRYFDLEIPAFMEASVACHRAAIDACCEVTASAYEDERVLGSGLRLHEATALEQLSLEWKLSPSWKYRRELLFRFCLNTDDFKSIALPPALYFLYPILRLPLWLKNRLFKSSSGVAAEG